MFKTIIFLTGVNSINLRWYLAPHIYCKSSLKVSLNKRKMKEDTFPLYFLSPTALFVLSLTSSALVSVLTFLSSAAVYLLSTLSRLLSAKLSLPSPSVIKVKMKTVTLCLICVLLVTKIFQTTQEKNNGFRFQANSASIEVYIEGTSLRFRLNNENKEGIPGGIVSKS